MFLASAQRAFPRTPGPADNGAQSLGPASSVRTTLSVAVAMLFSAYSHTALLSQRSAPDVVKKDHHL